MRFENICHIHAVKTHNGFKTELPFISFMKYNNSILLQI